MIGLDYIGIVAGSAKTQRLLARSKTAFTHPERVSLALAAAASYLAFLSSLTLNVRYSRSPFSFLGAPLGRFSMMHALCTNK